MKDCYFRSSTIVYLNMFRCVSIPEIILCVDGFNGDLSCPVAVFDKVCDGAEVDQSSATNPVPAWAPGQIHHTGGQRQICT